MTPDFKATTYYCLGQWYRRPESAACIADRFIRYVEALQNISPLLADMFVRVKTTATPFVIARPKLANFVQKTVEHDNGQITPESGYIVSAMTYKKANNFYFTGHVGRDYRSPDLNSLKFSTDMGYWPDLSLMTYPLFRATTLATVDCWEPLICLTKPSTLHAFTIKEGWYHKSWITYVHPSLVHRVTPPDIPVVEPTPDGGLLLAATTETFNVDNADHFEAARRICQATRHLDDVMPHLT